MKSIIKLTYTVVLLLCISLFVMAMSSCAKTDRGLLETLFTIEGRTAKHVPPSEIADLKEGIKKYGQQVNDTAEAMSKVAMYWRLLAGKYVEKGMYGDAYEAAKKALEHYPNSPSLYYTLGFSAAWLSKVANLETADSNYKRLAWLDIAEKAYMESIKLDSGNIRSLYGISVLYSFELNDQEKALQYIKQLLAVDKSNIDALFIYARALYGVGRLQESADAYDMIITLSKVESKTNEALANKKLVLEKLYGK